jgi:eukaryotic-like serine/threonine-protein kinase
VPGYRLDGRYELLYPYAQGGMATVWLARVQGKHGFEKLVAVKTILPHLARDEGFRTMFLDEASIASRIRHPNVADIIDLGEERDTIYMVLEWINGDSWSKLYGAVHDAGQPFPIHLLLRIGADACAGLHAAHELRDEAGTLLSVVHRDVSPQNVLITIGGVTKVIDFGIAKAMDRSAEATQTGMLKGKAQYTAPEQVRSKNVDRRADLWAIGTILYHYLSGRLPYEGKNDLATLKALNAGKPPPPLPASVPPAVAQVVMTALTPAVEHRFQTALDMQRALEAVMPQPVTSTDVAAFMAEFLQERMEMRRKDLADAIAESDERAGKPKGPRQRLGSFPELARPPILDQVFGRPGAGESSQMPQLSSVAAARIIGDPSTMPQPSPLGGASGMPQASPLGGASGMPQASPFAAQVGDDTNPTALRDPPPRLRPVHVLMLVVGAAVPMVVWGLVAWVAMHGPLGHKTPPHHGAASEQPAK